MVIDLATINFNGGGGGGGQSSKLEARAFSINRNGKSDVIPESGFDGMSSVTLYAQYDGNTTSAIDFSPIGYSDDLAGILNGKFNADLEYSKTLYDAWDENRTSANYLYSSNKNLVYAPNIDTSNVTDMGYMFSGCSNLKVVPQLNTSKVTSMTHIFQSCSSLITIPLLDTSNVTTFTYAFNGCENLTTIPQLDTSNVTDMSYIFTYCRALTSIPLLDFGKVTNLREFFGYYNVTTLTELGGFKNLKIDWSDTTGLNRLPNLTYQSVMNVINNLYDFRSNGDNTTTRTLKLNANSMALLSDDDKAIATSKGWILS